METHAQHLHKAPSQGWKHYVFEFFMLFLAVFSGFLAENQREHFVEKKREKQFIYSLLNDLQLDAGWLNTVTESANKRIQNIDSAILFLSGLKNNEIPVNIYQHLQKSTDQIMFISYDGTITQLKSAGGMRLITDPETVDSIENCDRVMRRLEIRREITNELTHDFTDILNKTVIGNDLLGALYDSVFFKKMILKKQTIKFNAQYMNELINSCISVRLRAVSDTSANGFTKRVALNTIKFLKKEYHIK